MNKVIYALLIVGLGTLPAIAKDTMEARMKAAESYVNGPAQQKMISAIMSPATVSAQLAAQFPNISTEKREKLSAIAAEELVKTIPELTTATQKAVAEIFSVKEIQALDAFYRSKEGTNILAKMQPMMARTYSLMAPAIQKVQKVLIKRFKTEMKK